MVYVFKGTFPQIYPTILPKIWIAMFKINIKTEQILETHQTPAFCGNKAIWLPRLSMKSLQIVQPSMWQRNNTVTPSNCQHAPFCSCVCSPFTGNSSYNLRNSREIPGVHTPKKSGTRRVAPAMISHTNCHGKNSLKLYRMVNRKPTSLRGS